MTSINDTDNQVVEAIRYFSNTQPAKTYAVRNALELDDRELDNSLRRLKSAGKVKFVRGQGAGWTVCQ